MTVMVETVVVVIVTERGGPSGAVVIMMHYCKHRTQTSLTHHLPECMWCTGQWRMVQDPQQCMQ